MRMMKMRRSVCEIVVEEGVCNEMKGDLVIEEFENLRSILVKKNSLENLNSLIIRNCKLLEKIETEDAQLDRCSCKGLFCNVKSVEISCLI